VTNVRPMAISGRWHAGYVLDYHTLSSTYVGDDEYGHPTFDTRRSDVGDLLYRLKYRGDKSVLDELVDVAASFVRSWNPGATILIPAPPSRPRAEQPVHLVADRLAAALGIPVHRDAVTRVKESPELKNVYAYVERLRLLEGAHRIDASIVTGQRVLLFDDLYRSGATMNTITAAPYEEGAAAEVYALALTRTRSRT
jgi:competence protein ComFC